MKQILLVIVLCHSVIVFGQYTFIPDPNFEQALINLGYDNNLDGQVLTNNINTIDSLPLSGLTISNLTGINNFSALEFLDCESCELTTIDLTNNSNLKYVNLITNFLTLVNVNGLDFLTTLTLSSNQLSNIDVSTNTSLQNLDISYNLISNINVQGNSSLLSLDCSNNLLTTLNLSNNLLLENLVCGNNSISSLNLSALSSLVNLNCMYNQLTTLDVSQNQSLTVVNSIHNNLSTVDINGSMSLQTISFDFNQISELNCSGTPQLKQLSMYSNNLNCLNIKNGNYTNWNNLAIQNNPSLSCIQVDDAVWASSNLNNWLDPQHSFSQDCNNACSNSFLGVTEENINQNKHLQKIINLLGQEVEYTPNTLLLYQYSDGTTEKVFTIEK
jgi:Leucine-rich repeat (LRR) protein